MAIEDIRAHYLRQHIGLLKDEVQNLSKEGVDAQDLAFKEAQFHCDRALDFLVDCHRLVCG
jgi:hypothetical protein